VAKVYSQTVKVFCSKIRLKHQKFPKNFADAPSIKSADSAQSIIFMIVKNLV